MRAHRVLLRVVIVTVNVILSRVRRRCSQLLQLASIPATPHHTIDQQLLSSDALLLPSKCLELLLHGHLIVVEECTFASVILGQIGYVPLQIGVEAPVLDECTACVEVGVLELAVCEGFVFEPAEFLVRGLVVRILPTPCWTGVVVQNLLVVTHAVTLPAMMASVLAWVEGRSRIGLLVSWRTIGSINCTCLGEISV